MATPNTSKKAKTKRNRPVDHTPPDKTGKKTKEALCPICNKKIPDTADEIEEPQEAVFCEGECSAWMHRQCVGLSLTMFSKLADSDEPFKCMHCMLKAQSHEIQQLKATVKILTDKLEAVKSNRSQQSDGDLNAPPSSLGSDGDNQQITAQRPLSNSDIPRQTSQTISQPFFPQRKKSNDTFDRRYNVVVYGIEESSSKLSKTNRTQSDLEKVVSILPNVNSSSIKDLHRLGKFKLAQERPRPIIVKFLRALDAKAVLSDHNNIPSSVLVKPDMSPERRNIESKLLKERYKLIQQGISRKSIKIRNTQLYVNNQLHGQVKDSVFQLASVTGHSSSVQPDSESAMTDSSSPPHIDIQLTSEAPHSDPESAMS